MGIQNNSSHNSSVQKEHPLIEQGAFLVPVPIDKPTFLRFTHFHIHLNLLREELEILRSGNKETLASVLCKKTAPTKQGGFLCPIKGVVIIISPLQIIFGLLLLITAVVLIFDIRCSPFENSADYI